MIGALLLLVNREPTSNDVIEFVLQERDGTNAFLHYSRHDLYITLGRAAADNLCFVSVGDDNRVDGVVTSQVAIQPKTLEITNLLCTSRQAVRNLITKYYEHWHGYHLIAERRNGKMIHYKDTNKLLKKLSNYA